MSNHTAGWVVFVAALGMFTGLIAVEVQSLEAWESAKAPMFIGKALFNFSIVVTAFVGGKLIPNDRTRP